MPLWGFIAMCAAAVALGLWMVVGTESYWRAQHRLTVKNVRTVEPHEASLTRYRVSGVVLIVGGVWFAIHDSGSVVERNLRDDLRELFGAIDVQVYEPKEKDGEIRGKMGLGPHYFEATPERIEVLEDAEGDDVLREHPRTAFLVSVEPWVEEVSVEEAGGRVTVTAWQTCTKETEDRCDKVEEGPLPSVSGVRVVPISLRSPLGERVVVDGATGKKLAPFVGE
jgi:hypothetical protein